MIAYFAAVGSKKENGKKKKKKNPVALAQYYLYHVGSHCQNLHVPYPGLFQAKKGPPWQLGASTPYLSDQQYYEALCGYITEDKGVSCFVGFFFFLTDKPSLHFVISSTCSKDDKETEGSLSSFI